MWVYQALPSLHETWDFTIHKHAVLWKCAMHWAQEIPEDLWKRVTDAHQPGKGYKTISAVFSLHFEADEIQMEDI